MPASAADVADDAMFVVGFVCGLEVVGFEVEPASVDVLVQVVHGFVFLLRRFSWHCLQRIAVPACGLHSLPQLVQCNGCLVGVEYGRIDPVLAIDVSAQSNWSRSWVLHAWHTAPAVMFDNPVPASDSHNAQTAVYRSSPPLSLA